MTIRRKTCFARSPSLRAKTSPPVWGRYYSPNAALGGCWERAFPKNSAMATVNHSSGATQSARLEEPGLVSATRRRLDHPELVRSLQRAYSAERAASFAYIGHAGSLRDPVAKATIKQIEVDEWAHRRHVRAIMQAHDIPVSHWFEMQYYAIGKLIAGSCYVIGW